MNVEIRTETLIFLFWEYLFRNIGILSLQCDGFELCFQGAQRYLNNVQFPYCAPSEVATLNKVLFLNQ